MDKLTDAFCNLKLSDIAERVASIYLNEWEWWAFVEGMKHALGNDAFGELEQGYTEPDEAEAPPDAGDNDEAVSKDTASLVENKKAFVQA